MRWDGSEWGIRFQIITPVVLSVDRLTCRRDQTIENDGRINNKTQTGEEHTRPHTHSMICSTYCFSSTNCSSAGIQRRWVSNVVSRLAIRSSSKDHRLTILVVVEVGQERDQTFPIASQDVLDHWWFLRVGDKHLGSERIYGQEISRLLVTRAKSDFKQDTHLEDVESFELNILALVAQQVHHQLEIFLRRNVSRHHVKVCSIQQNLSQQLQRLSLRHVVG